MPYCVECGKEIPQNIRIKNNGECDNCLAKHPNSQPIVSSPPQNSGSLLEKCAYCQTMTSIRCETCKKPLCQNHIEMWRINEWSDMHFVCEQCHSDKKKEWVPCQICFCLAIISSILVPLLSKIK